MSTTVGPETAVLTVVRFSIFYACRKYLLRVLYSDLRNLSTSATPGTPVNSRFPDGSTTPTRENIELETLPLPSTHTPKSGRFYTEDALYLHTAIARTIFSWCLAESCMLFFLLMLQGAGIFSSSTRLLNWRFSLFFLMAAMLVIIPLSLSLLLALGSRDSWTFKSLFGPRAILSLVPVGLYLFALTYVPLPSTLEPTDASITFLSRLIVLGTIILGLLSGFGAVSNSWQFLPFGNRAQAVPTEQDVDTAQYALTSIRNDLKARRAEEARREGTTAEGSWMSRVGSTFRGADGLTQEIQGLESLEYQMSRNLESLREKREAAKFASTIQGQIFHIVGKVFAVYCVIRVISSIYNVVFLPSRRSSSTTYPDVITDLLAYFLSHFTSHASDISHDQLASFARQISLVLVGVIILSSIRLVLRGATKALRVTSRNLAASLMLLVLAQIMGIYLLSTLVQMRSSFPPPPEGGGEAQAGANLFSTIPTYEVFGSLFDWSFLAAAGVSVVVRWGAERVNGVGDD